MSQAEREETADAGTTRECGNSPVKRLWAAVNFAPGHLGIACASSADNAEAARPGAIFLFLDVEDTLWSEIAALAASLGRPHASACKAWLGSRCVKMLLAKVYGAAAAISER